ncbi:AraC family transcriptional regulator [Niastella koreensis]|uniref:Transcriptional regulator, AraC family n=2 Tax=Niastella koreensis TaxID=354356 RepID=G8TGY7_NIAKG|nr:helix-turn-helix transcriptional regulator [Niastella koreensis]AEV99589.1 transcriptional regulator, AraC family [Niastella koreensis GR20-10]OQP50179.1 AraC family transcriptional regulator [Niastella koreensis]
MKAIPVRQITTSCGHKHTGRFSIRNLQQVLDGKALVHDLHKHDFYFVLAVLEGKGKHEIDFIHYPIQNHTIFLLRPGQVHRLELTGDSTGFLMEFDLSFYRPKHTITERRWMKASGKNYCKLEVARFKKLHKLLATVAEEYALQQEGYSEAIRANLDLFFIEFIRQSHTPNSLPKPESGYIQERFDELTRLLEANIVNMKNVSQYAGLLNLSAYQLNAITKASVGKTVSELINEQIVLEAKRHLLVTPNQIKEIADLLGFEDPSYFIRFFKKHTGLSPDAFRKAFK